MNDPFGLEEIADFVSVEFLRDRALAPEEAIAALDRLGVAFADVHGENSPNGFHPHLHERVAISRDVLDAGTEPIGVLDPADGAVITHAQKNLSANGVGQSDHLPGERRRKVLFELDRRAFALLKQDVKVSGRHAEPSITTELFGAAKMVASFVLLFDLYGDSRFPRGSRLSTSSPILDRSGYVRPGSICCSSAVRGGTNRSWRLERSSGS